MSLLTKIRCLKEIENERNPRNGWILEFSDKHSDDSILCIRFRLCDKDGRWIAGDNPESDEDFDLCEIENEEDLKRLIERVCLPKKKVYATADVQHGIMAWFNMFLDMRDKPLKYQVEPLYDE